MIIRDAIEEIISEDEFDPEVGEEEEQLVYPEEGKLLMIRRNLTIARKEEEQRDIIFYTCYNVHGKVYGLIIYSRSCTNVASTTLVSKLNLALLNTHILINCNGLTITEL